MNVILLTAFIGLMLVGLALAFFFYLRRSGGDSGPERDSLLPLEEEKYVRANDAQPLGGAKDVHPNRKTR